MHFGAPSALENQNCTNVVFGSCCVVLLISRVVGSLFSRQQVRILRCAIGVCRRPLAAGGPSAPLMSSTSDWKSHVGAPSSHESRMVLFRARPEFTCCCSERTRKTQFTDVEFSMSKHKVSERGCNFGVFSCDVSSRWIPFVASRSLEFNVCYKRLPAPISRRRAVRRESCKVPATDQPRNHAWMA